MVAGGFRREDRAAPQLVGGGGVGTRGAVGLGETPAERQRPANQPERWADLPAYLVE